MRNTVGMARLNYSIIRLILTYETTKMFLEGRKLLAFWNPALCVMYEDLGGRQPSCSLVFSC